MRYFDREAMTRPEVFESERFQNARQKLAEYLADDERLQRQRRAPIEPAIITNREVRRALVTGFAMVCAYCESDLSSDDFDVDQFRPKSVASGQKDRTDHRHYSWLAYEWDNLYPTCRRCNVFKTNKFNVVGPRGAIGASVRELRVQEKALLLDPCHDDIAAHLTFGLTGRARGKTDRGDATIEMLVLNREYLVKQRRTQLELVARFKLEDSLFGHWPTGLSEGWASSILVESNGRASPYAGATTLALLEWASKNGMPQLQDLGDFLVRWRKWSQGERRRLNAALAEGSPLPEVQSSSAVPPAPVGSPRSRTLRIREIEPAERPLSSVHIRNFKALASIDLVLPTSVENSELVPCMLILGENATGKSSVLEAIALALVGTRETGELNRLVAADAISPRGVSASARHRELAGRPEGAALGRRPFSGCRPTRFYHRRSSGRRFRRHRASEQGAPRVRSAPLFSPPAQSTLPGSCAAHPLAV